MALEIMPMLGLPIVSPSDLATLKRWLAALRPPAPGMYSMMTVGFPGRYFCTNVATALVRRSPVPPGSLPWMMVTVFPWKKEVCAPVDALIAQNKNVRAATNVDCLLNFGGLNE